MERFEDSCEDDGNCTFEQRDFNSEGAGAITMS